MTYYRLARNWRIATYLLSPILIFAFLIAIYFCISFGENSWYTYLLIPVFLGLIVVFIYAIVDARNGGVIISEEHITLKDPVGDRKLRLQDIKGFRTDSNYIYLIPFDDRLKRIRISTYLERSQEVTAWATENFQRMDVIETVKELEEILDNENYGINYEARAAKLKEAKRVARFLHILSWAATLWLLLYPQPYDIVIVTSLGLPWILLVAVFLYRGLIKVKARDEGAYPSLAIPFAVLACALTYRAVMDFYILRYNTGWTFIFLFALVVFSLFLYPSREWKLKKIDDFFFVLLFLLFSLLYTYSVSVILNCMLDGSEGKYFRSRVVSKTFSKGKTYTYYLKVAPWGNFTEVQQVKVTRGQYEVASEGDSINIIQRNGYLNMDWAIVRVKGEPEQDSGRSIQKR